MANLNANLRDRFPDLDATAVGEIVDTDLSAAQMNNFINMAWYMTRPLAGNLSDCGGQDAEAEIIKLLAAHFSVVYEQIVVSERIGDYSVTYADITSKGFLGSRFGQAALALDCSGKLRQIGMKKATMDVIGYQHITDDYDSSTVIVI